MEGVSWAALIVSIGSLLSQLHIRRVHTLCFDSDCRKMKSEPPTPVVVQPKLLSAPILAQSDEQEGNSN